ncbi:MAG: undecaprenyl-diphosphate phosphatase [Candidatus Pacebacteria bacterium]|nr:undecaprenyl-diphosphate phosphatase [Candidatus Paceibacterota bacterium]
MLTYIQAIVLGVVQGVTELFPVSSLGHSVILPALFGWNLDQGADFFLTFLVATHFATALVLFVFFWKDWKRIIVGLLRSIKRITIVGDADARLGWLLVLGTVPAGLIGLLFQSKVQALFASPKYVSIFLLCNGLILFGAEYLRKRKSGITNNQETITKPENLSQMSWANSFKIGISQALALIPGLSRTGSALGGGLLVGLDHEDAARFAFLLATPIIGAAALLKLPHFLLHLHSYPAGPIFVGAICAAIGAYLSVKFLLRYFKTKTLTPFAIYCVLAGATSAVFFFFR